MDYRGYGRSGGYPRAATLLSDAHIVYEDLDGILEANQLTPDRIYVMGRSLGSAAAIHIAHQDRKGLSGMIIESGFAHTFALLRQLGVRVEGADEAQDVFNNLVKIAEIETPTLIIHGDQDVLIPPSDGQALYEYSGAKHKKLVLIPEAGHNDIMMLGMRIYFQAIQEFTGR
jgi:pimeloyl-ACP methyl ester carboxylesterase